MSDYQEGVKKELGRFLELTKECEQAARMKEIDRILALLKKRQDIIDAIDDESADMKQVKSTERDLVEAIARSNASLEKELVRVRDMTAGELQQARREKRIAHYELDSVEKTRLFDIGSL